MTRKEINEFVAQLPETATYDHYEVEHLKINYISTGGGKLPKVVFIHGSPRSLSAFTHFLKDEELNHLAELITIDRPGFGHSNFGWSEKFLKKQSQLLKPIIDSEEAGIPVILVGHSLGGSLVARMQ